MVAREHSGTGPAAPSHRRRFAGLRPIRAAARAGRDGHSCAHRARSVDPTRHRIRNILRTFHGRAGRDRDVFRRPPARTEPDPGRLRRSSDVGATAGRHRCSPADRGRHLATTLHSPCSCDQAVGSAAGPSRSLPRSPCLVSGAGGQNDAIVRRARLSGCCHGRGRAVNATVPESITCPVLLVWGEHDVIVPPSCAHQMHDKLPDSELAVFAGAGHSPMIEFPHQFNDLALRFIAARNGNRGAA